MGDCADQALQEARKMKGFDDVWEVEREALAAMEDEIHLLKELYGDDRKKIQAEFKNFSKQYEVEIKNRALEQIQNRLKAAEVSSKIIDEGTDDFGKSLSRTKKGISDFYRKIESSFHKMANYYNNQMFRIALVKKGKEMKIDLLERVNSKEIIDDIHKIQFHVQEALGVSVEDADIKGIAPKVAQVVDAMEDVPDDVKEIFKILNNMHTAKWLDMKDAGINVGFQVGRFMTRTHDANKILALGNFDKAKSKQAWAKMLYPLLNLKKTFPSLIIPDAADAATIKKFQAQHIEILEGMAERIIDSKGRNYVSETDLGTKKFRPTRKNRITFADAASESKYFKEFSPYDNILEGVVRQNDRTAKKIATTAVFGTEPNKVMEQVTDRINKKYVGNVKEDDLIQSYNDWDKTRGENVFLGVNGTTRHLKRLHDITTQSYESPAHWLDNFARIIKTLSGLKLGMSSISAAFDLTNTSIVHAKTSGENVAMSYMKSIQTFLDTARMGLKQDGLAFMAHHLNMEMLFSDYSTVLGATSGSVGFHNRVLKKGFDYFMKGTLLPWQTIRSKMTNARLQSEVLTKMVDFVKKNEEALSSGKMEVTPEMKFYMDRFDLTLDEFRIIAKHGEKVKELGNIYTSSRIKDLPEEAFLEGKENATAAQRRRKRDDLWRKWDAFVDEAVNQGTPTPGNEAKLMFGKDSQNPLARTFLNIISQFKETAWQASISNYRSIQEMRAIRGDMSTAGQMSQAMVASMALYIGLDSLKAWARNRKSHMERAMEGDEGAWFDFITNWASMSGAGALTADFFSVAGSKGYGVDLKDFVLGPGVDLASDFSKMAVGDMMLRQNFEKPLRKFRQRHLPYENTIPGVIWDKLTMGADLMDDNKFKIHRYPSGGGSSPKVIDFKD